VFGIDSMAGAIDWLLTLQQADAAKETTDEAKKRAHRRYADAAVALSKAERECDTIT
jgi:type I restriction enzyme, R subunit